MKVIKVFKGPTLFFIIIWVIFFIPFSVYPATAKSLEKVILQLKWLHQFQFAGHYAAIEKGYYADAGLQVILKEGRPGISYSDVVISGDADYGIDMPILLLEQQKGKSIVVLAAIFQHSPEVMLTRKDSRIKSPHDLINKKIMLRPLGNIESRAMFQNEGIPLVKLKIIDHTWNINDLIDRKVDSSAGYITDRPFLLQERGVPYTIIRPLTYGVDFYGDCLFTTKEEIDTHPQRVKAFLDASIKGWEYAMNHPEEIVDLILKKYSIRLSKEALLFEANAMQELLQSQLIEIGHMNPGRWKHIADTFVKLKMLRPEYSLEGFLYDPNPRPDYVGAIRIVRILVGLIIVVFLSVVILLIFNRKLASQVSGRTKHLSLEIAERKLAEKALEESQERFQYLANASMEALFFSKDGICLEVNQAAVDLFGYADSSELIGIFGTEVIASGSYKIVKEHMLNNSSDPYEAVGRRKDGTQFSIAVKAKTMSYKNKGLVRVTSIIDISDRKKAEEEKIEAQKVAGEHKKLALVGQIAGKMAHDFNNILGIIMGNTELSLLDCKDTETKKIFELILEQTIRGKNLTKNLVAFAKDQEPQQVFFRINEKINLVLSLLKKDLKGIELIMEDTPGTPELLADSGMIEHALINLIQNSIHAISMTENPRIIIRMYSLDDNICFEIEDNGCGIREEHMENIYEPSFSLKANRDTTGSYKIGIKGTGYGMSNVKKYIEQHKGKIFIESVFGSGTKVTISLPVIKKELTKEEKAVLRKEKVYSEKYILLLEDETAISGVQYRILTQDPYNHKVDIANNGKVAMDLFDRNKYDFVSLDYMLPGKINGMDVYNYIRETNKIIPILFISGNIEFLESINELKQKDGKIDHRSKPCQNKDYVGSINELFERTIVSRKD